LLYDRKGENIMQITKEKSTGDLEGEIKSADSADEFLAKNSEYLLKQSISDALNEALYRTGTTIPMIIKSSGLSKSYIYHVLTESVCRRATR